MASADNLRITITVDSADLLRIESASRRVLRWRQANIIATLLVAVLAVALWVFR